jgi:pSer/pThr/pTyr-binding forkhead associated (FHA) protein
MAVLRYSSDGVPVEVTLDSADITIGRADDCTLQLRGDAEVSRLHCSIQRRDGDHFLIMDSASRNGTFVNGVRLMDEAKELEHGDRIRVGKTKMVYYQLKTHVEVSGTEDLFEEVAKEMEEEGKGFRTIMNEILEPPSAKGAGSTGSE